MGEFALPRLPDERYPDCPRWESLEPHCPLSRTWTMRPDESVMAGPDPRDATPCRQAMWMADRRQRRDFRLPVAFSATLATPGDPQVRRAPGPRRTCRQGAGLRCGGGGSGWEDPFDAFWPVVTETDLTGMRRSGYLRRPDVAAPGRPGAFATGPPSSSTDGVMTRKAVCQQDVAVHEPVRPVPQPRCGAALPVHMQGPEIIDGRACNRRHG